MAASGFEPGPSSQKTDAINTRLSTALFVQQNAFIILTFVINLIDINLFILIVLTTYVFGIKSKTLFIKTISIAHLNIL